MAGLAPILQTYFGTRTTRIPTMQELRYCDVLPPKRDPSVDLIIGSLSERLEEKVKSDDLLIQSGASMISSCQVLNTELAEEKQQNIVLRTRLEETEKKAKAIRFEIKTRTENELRLCKQRNTLQVRSVDLKMDYERQKEKERTLRDSSDRAASETDKWHKELTFEKIKNERLRILLEETAKDDSISQAKMVRQGQAVKGNALKVSVISLQKDNEELGNQCDKLKADIADGEDNVRQLQAALKLETDAADVVKRALGERLLEEEGMNKRLRGEWVNRSRVKEVLYRDREAAEQTRQALGVRLEKQDLVSLAMSSQLSKVQQRTQALERRLQEKCDTTNDLSALLGTVKLNLKSLQGQLTSERHTVSMVRQSLSQQQKAAAIVSLKIEHGDEEMRLQLGRLSRAISKEEEATNAVHKTRLMAKQEDNEIERLEHEESMRMHTIRSVQDRLNKATASMATLQSNFDERTQELSALKNSIEPERDQKKIIEMGMELGSRNAALVRLNMAQKRNEAEMNGHRMENLRQAEVDARSKVEDMLGTHANKTAANKLLNDNLKSEKKRGARMEKTLGHRRDRLNALQAQLMGDEKTALGIAFQNTSQNQRVLDDIDRTIEKVEALTELRCKVQLATRILEQRTEDEDATIAVETKQLKRCEELVSRLKKGLDDMAQEEELTLQRMARESERDIQVEAELDARLATEAEGRLQRDELENKINYISEERKDRESSIVLLEAEQATLDARSADLRSTIDGRAHTHTENAADVRAAIVKLRAALMSKMEEAEKLTNTIQVTGTKLKEFRRLFDDAVNANAIAAKMQTEAVQEKQQIGMGYRQSLLQKKDNIVQLEEMLRLRELDIQNENLNLEDAATTVTLFDLNAHERKTSASIVANEVERREGVLQRMKKTLESKREEAAALRDDARRTQLSVEKLGQKLEQARQGSAELTRTVKARQGTENSLKLELLAYRGDMIQDNKSSVGLRLR